MVAIIQLLVNGLVCWILYGILRESKMIAADTRKKDELNDALEKFGQLVLDQKEKKKIVAFRAKKEDV